MTADNGPLSNFIEDERYRYSTEDNNLFASAFAQVSRYYDFLRIILQRHRVVSAQLIDNTQLVQTRIAQRGPGTHALPPEDMQALQEGQHLGITVHLEIESFYIFAKMLLDRMAHAVEFYFGPARKLSLDSHDDLVKSIAEYSQIKGLVLADELVLSAERLKHDVSDFRDYQIAHEKSPRTLRATAFDASGRTRMVLGKIYPKEGDVQQEARHIDEILADIDTYVSLVIQLIQSNRKKTRLHIVAQEGG